VQAVNSEPSREQPNETAPSLLAKVNVAPVAVVGSEGPSLTTGTGVSESRYQKPVPAVLVFPARSTAVTAYVCKPSAAAVTDFGLEQVAATPPSRLHR
jgi:hypothetical protein